MSCHVGEVTESLENEHSPFSKPSIALPTSQLILQSFRCFTYIATHSPTLLLLLLRHSFFIYVTWQAAHAFMQMISILWCGSSWPFGNMLSANRINPSCHLTVNIMIFFLLYSNCHAEHNGEIPTGLYI